MMTATELAENIVKPMMNQTKPKNLIVSSPRSPVELILVQIQGLEVGQHCHTRGNQPDQIVPIQIRYSRLDSAEIPSPMFPLKKLLLKLSIVRLGVLSSR